MKNFISVKDVPDLEALVQETINLKKNPFEHKFLGLNKTLGLIFFNPSLRTRISTQKAALNLGMNVMVMNIDKEGWSLETADGAVMNGNSAEHIKEAAAVMGQYCDILGIRTFPKLINREEDDSEEIINKFSIYSGIPVISLESSTLHPLQSLADLVTITENASLLKKPKVVLCWAPHVKPLPQAVPNSFSEWMGRVSKTSKIDFVIAQPAGYELNPKFTQGAMITMNQKDALMDADFIYVKNWSSYKDYGKMPAVKEDWLITERKMALTNNAKIMHCLPVRREVEMLGELIDSERSLIIKQVQNRVYAAQAVLKQILEKINEKVIYRKEAGLI